MFVVADTLGSELEEVVYHTGEFLRWLVVTCVDEALVVSCLNETQGTSAPGGTARPASRAPPHALRRVCSAVERLLGYQSQTSWDHALRIAGALFEKLGPASETLLPGVVLTLGELQELSEHDMPFRRQLNECLGCAVAAMGPAALLSQLPLNLSPGTSLTKARTWLFPLLKTYTVGAQLRYFATDLLPLAQSLQRRAKEVQELFMLSCTASCARALPSPWSSHWGLHLGGLWGSLWPCRMAKAPALSLCLCVPCAE